MNLLVDERINDSGQNFKITVPYIVIDLDQLEDYAWLSYRFLSVYSSDISSGFESELIDLK